MHGKVVKRGPSRRGGPARARPWAYIIELGLDAGGKRRQVWRSGFATRREANAALQQDLAARRASGPVDPHRRTLGEFLTQQWLPALVTVRPSTLRSYRQHVEQYLVSGLGSLRLQELTTPLLNTFYRQLLAGSGQRGRAPSPATLRRIHATLRSALSTAVRWRLLPHNPAAAAELPPAPRTEMTVWTPRQLHAFLQAAAGDPLAPLYALMAATGLRRGEAVALRWADVDLAAGSLTVRRQHVDVGYRVVAGEPKTKRGARTIALDASTAADLRDHHEHQQAKHRALGVPTGRDAFVFTRPDGSPYHPDYVTKHFNLLVARSGLPRIRLHDLRHTHATLGLAAGVPARVMADRLGHSSTALTLDVYSHVTPALDRDAADRIAAFRAVATDSLARSFAASER